jgi:hypothetical protein
VEVIMRCPKCSQEGFQPYATCPRCGFSGAPGPVEELGHVAYLLGEIDTWHEVESMARNQLRERYLGRRERLETGLGLRPPLDSAELVAGLSAEEARRLQWEVYCLGQLQAEVARWQERGWVHAESAERLRQGAQKRAETLGERLAAAPPAPAFDNVRDQLNLFDYLAGILEQADQRGHFVNDVCRAAAQATLQARRVEFEISAGLRPRPAEAAPAPVIEAPAPTAKPAKPAKPPRPPREPLTWDRVWQTLLSERTLNVLLFLGAFLLVASATTYIVYNWETLPPAVQLGFIVLFTLSFYGAGWFLRTRMKLRASGIAVTAIGSLLVPLDFYAVGIAGGVVPAERWAWVWLVASLVCLPIYTFTAIRIQAGFFGYTVAVAAGSLVCAAVQVMGLPPEWFLTALVATALGLAAVAYRLKAPSPRGGEGRGEGEIVTLAQTPPSPGPSPEGGELWTVLSRPFRFTSLIATAVVLPLGIGWWLVGGASGSQFDTSLALSWALGAILFVYAAQQERSPLLGRAAATALPVALGLLLRLAFETWAVETPWYALIGALLAPAYLLVGHRLYANRPGSHARQTGGMGAASAERAQVLRAHGRTATAWGLALMAIAAGWAVFDLWAAAATHALLVAGVALAVRLWDRPRALPLASLLAFSSITFGMAAGHLEPAELCVGWALLAVLHVVVALRLPRAPEYASRLFAASLVTAFLALLPPALLRHEPLLTYALGHWLGLSLWLLWLDQRGEHAGLTALLSRFGPLRDSALHWAVALPLPFFVTMLYLRFQPVDGWLGFVLVLLAWACFGIGRLGIGKLGNWSLVLRRWSFPWYVVAYGCSLAGPLLALHAGDRPLLGVTILLASALYFVSAWAFRADQWLIPGGLALPLGLFVLLSHWQVGWPEQSVAYAAVVAAYLLTGVWLERRRGVAGEFMASLYAVAHLVAVVALFWGLAPALNLDLASNAVDVARGRSPGLDKNLWSDAARLWAAGGQLLLAVAYGLFAWFRQRERWAHVAVWLGVLAGGLIASAYSQGRGSSAFKVALLAMAYVLAERLLTSRVVRQRWAAAEKAWGLYRRPLLIAGWAVSAGAIGLALVRNLVLLQGNRVQTTWAIAGLLTVTALYAASAWMFRRRLFVWLAGALVFAPWTVLTLWGWFVWDAPPPLPRYALSWAVLACLQLALGLLLSARGGPQSAAASAGLWSSASRSEDLGFPLRVLANLLLPFALFWGVADVGTSSLTWGLGLACYVASAVADHRRGLGDWRAARFLYPAVLVLPVWAVYLLNHLLPTAPYETYGLLLLILVSPLLGVGRWLRRFDAADGLPFYLGAYGTAIVGTLLVAHVQPLFALALAFDALLCVLSAWIFREPVWGFPAAALGAAALLTALAVSSVPPERRGWWLISLGLDYLLLAWTLRRGRLRAYATPPLAMAFLVTALGLPPSSLDDTGAFWGYLAAAGVYALAAAWLRQPLLLAATAGLLAVPYGVGVVWLGVNPADYGLAIFPGVAAALALGHLLDWLVGRDSIPAPRRVWKPGLLDWWAGPFYAWGYIGALVGVGLSLRLGSGQAWSDSTRLAVALGLAALTFLHATWRFRSRAFLLLAGALAQASALAVIDVVGWLEHPAWAALAFLPVTVVTAGIGLAVELVRGDGSPLCRADWQSALRGWSRVFYLLLAADLVGGQIAALFGAEPGAAATVGHGLLLALLATVWVEPVLPFVAAGLGVIGLFQGMAWAGAELTAYPVGLALLALGYGLAGYGLRFAWGKARRVRVWLKPLEWSALGLSAGALLLAVGVGGLNVGELLVRTLLGQAVTVAAFYAPELRMMMWVLALSGLLYLAAAVVRRWTVLGYGAVALLLAAWGLWWRFFLDMPGFQWYAVPAGAYLLGIGWSEWQQGRRGLARWIDRAGMLVWLGSAWWQSLPGVMPGGWPYALLMGAEALLMVWWGSARRLRRFLYVGAVAVVLDAVTQAIEPLLSANRWIVFGIVGALLVGIAILVERNLNKIRELSVEVRGWMEGWE